MPKLLFLGYDRSQTRLIEVIEAYGWEVEQVTDQVKDFSSYDLVTSFGYRHIFAMK